MTMKPNEMMGVNQLVFNENHNYLDDLQTQKKRLGGQSYQHYHKVNTMTSNEFGNLNVPATDFTKYRPLHERPYYGNWTAMQKEEPSNKDPAGQRIPKPAEIGLGEELPKIAVSMRNDGKTDDEIVETLVNEKQKGVSRYNKGNRIGQMLEEANQQLLRKARHDLSEKALMKLKRKQEIDAHLKSGGIYEKR